MTDRPLLVVGSGGLAREVIAAMRAGAGPGLAPVGLLDDAAARHGVEVDGLRVLGPAELVAEHPDAAVVLCVGSSRDPGGRLRLAGRLGLPRERYATVVHPAASLAHGTDVGAGTLVLAGCVVTAPQRIGMHVVAMPQVLLTHDDEVMDGVTMAGRVALAGGVRVGEAAYLGAGALVREGVRIGAGARVGMGAVVLEDVPAGQTWAGVPARPLATGRKVGAR